MQPTDSAESAHSVRGTVGRVNRLALSITTYTDWKPRGFSGISTSLHHRMYEIITPSRKHTRSLHFHSAKTDGDHPSTQVARLAQPQRPLGCRMHAQASNVRAGQTVR